LKLSEQNSDVATVVEDASETSQPWFTRPIQLHIDMFQFVSGYQNS